MPRTRSRAWALLVLSGVLEAVWASALGASDGFGRAGATALFAVALALSMLTLARAARVVPMGTAYAVWTGIGAVLTAGWALGTGQEEFSWLKALFLAGIVGCVVGLHAAEPGATGRRDAGGRAAEPGATEPGATGRRDAGGRAAEDRA